MTYYDIPHFVIKKNFQKGGDFTFQDILNEEILSDICIRATGVDEYTVDFDDESYNKGRLAIIYYENSKIFVSFSVAGKVESRNSSFQSIPTALVKYHNELNPNKKMCYYFLEMEGSYETNYHNFMYRTMATAGIEFLNQEEFLRNEVISFASIEDLIAIKDINRNSRLSNASTYLTKTEHGNTEIYAKTFGANKKEAVLITFAASELAENIILYEITEQSLTNLPRIDKNSLEMMGNITILSSDRTIEARIFERQNSLRSPTFIYNLLDRLGPKSCALCNCEIPELIEGAHIWPVADIKRDGSLSEEAKLEHAIDKNNGIWLCVNHHKMFDEELIRIHANGEIVIRTDMKELDQNYIEETTFLDPVPFNIINEEVSSYLDRRYEHFES